MYLTIIIGLLDLGISSGVASEISRQLEVNGRAEVLISKDNLRADVLKGRCTISGFSIRPESQPNNAGQFNLIVERTVN